MSISAFGSPVSCSSIDHTHTHTHTHTRTHTHTYTHARAHIHARTHTHSGNQDEMLASVHDKRLQFEDTKKMTEISTLVSQ